MKNDVNIVGNNAGIKTPEIRPNVPKQDNRP